MRIPIACAQVPASHVPASSRTQDNGLALSSCALLLSLAGVGLRHVVEQNWAQMMCVNNWDTIKQKRSKTFDRQFWWLKDREAQLQFHVIWDAGIYNLADYPTKHHTGQHHKLVRPIYLFESGKTPRTMQECEAILAAGKPAKKALLTIRKYRSLLAAAAA